MRIARIDGARDGAPFKAPIRRAGGANADWTRIVVEVHRRRRPRRDRRDVGRRLHGGTAGYAHLADGRLVEAAEKTVGFMVEAMSRIPPTLAFSIACVASSDTMPWLNDTVSSSASLHLTH